MARSTLYKLLVRRRCFTHILIDIETVSPVSVPLAAFLIFGTEKVNLRFLMRLHGTYVANRTSFARGVSGNEVRLSPLTLRAGGKRRIIAVMLLLVGSVPEAE